MSAQPPPPPYGPPPPAHGPPPPPGAQPPSDGPPPPYGPPPPRKRNTAVIVVVAVVGALIGLGAIGAVLSLVTDDDEISAFDLQEGDCIEVPDPGEVSDVSGTPCTEPHDGEVYALFDLDGSDYPGEKVADREALRGCADRFESFIGKSYRSSELLIYYLQPTETSWETKDDREVVCAVTEPKGKMTTVETLEGANR